MFAGKTTYIINEINNTNMANKKQSNCNILTFNHYTDTRYANERICSHDNVEFPCVAINEIKKIKPLINNLRNKSTDRIYIFIDECQFFDDLYEEIINIMKMENISIYLAGLDGDFKQQPFKTSKLLDLIPYASKVLKLTAKCYKCDKKAPFSKRLIASNETILVGGADMYQPCCYFHLNNE
jgi:thymidine kinase